MEERFLAYINKHQLFTLADRVMVAVSGGKDSMVLLHLLHVLKFKIGVAHCNFQLRAEDSDGDEAFVRAFCEEREIPFFSVKFETKKYTARAKVSTQMAARTLRYEWFEKLLKEENYDYLATAHHLNDSIETLILNISKGTGPKGLSSIPNKTQNIVRPLLFASSENIKNYIDTNAITWREDGSNATTDYQRNKIRHEVMPILKEINPGLEQTVSINLERFADLRAIFEHQLSEFEKQVLEIQPDGILIDFEKVLAFAGYPLLLEEYLKPFGFNINQVKDMLGSNNSSTSFLSESHQILCGRKSWFLSEKSQHKFKPLVISEFGEFSIGVNKLIVEKVGSNIAPSDLKNPNFAFLDLDKIQWPLTLRTWQQGDVFVPFGMKGKKLISDFLIDLKIEPHHKKTQLLLCDQAQVLWVCKRRINDSYRCYENSKNVLKVTFF
jgi:tRNA(Ile)-lysidine synthase